MFSSSSSHFLFLSAFPFEAISWPRRIRRLRRRNPTRDGDEEKKQTEEDKKQALSSLFYFFPLSFLSLSSCFLLLSTAFFRSKSHLALALSIANAGARTAGSPPCSRSCSTVTLVLSCLLDPPPPPPPRPLPPPPSEKNQPFFFSSSSSFSLTTSVLPLSSLKDLFPAARPHTASSSHASLERPSARVTCCLTGRGTTPSAAGADIVPKRSPTPSLSRPPAVTAPSRQPEKGLRRHDVQVERSERRS